MFKGILWNVAHTEGFCLFALNLQSMDSAPTLASGVEQIVSQKKKEALENFNSVRLFRCPDIETDMMESNYSEA